MLPEMSRDSYAQRQGIQMNATEIEAVFAKYEAVGFLYPAKKRLLSPHFTQITEHWERLLASREQLLWILSAAERQPTSHFASITVWKQSNFGCFSQHLVSTGNPYLSLKVMLEAQAIAEHQYSEKEIRSSQNWFRPNNRYAYRVFASMYDKLGDSKAALIHHQYLHLPLSAIPTSSQERYVAEPVQGIDLELIQFVKKQYGEVFVRGEELDQCDIQLERHGQLFQQYGLGLARKVFKIRDCQSGKTVACLIANRAPLGLNFSFLENRAYYILDQKLPEEVLPTLLTAMHQAVQATYEGIPIGVIPIVTDERSALKLEDQGADRIREYVQSIWLRDGFRQWYEHIDSFLQRIQRRALS